MARRFSVLVALAATVAEPVLAEGAGFEALRGHGGPVMGADVVPDGSAALTASFDNSVGFWELDTGEVVECMHNHTDQVAIGQTVDVAVTADHDLSWFPAGQARRDG